MQIKNISEHRPKNMIIDVAEEDVKALIKTGEFVESTKENLIIEKKVKEEEVDELIDVPHISWTEKEIDEWVNENTSHIKYYPTKHTKKYILDKLKEENLI